MAITLFSSSGQKLTLGSKLGQGGEGAVYEIAEQEQSVAKIYHQSIGGPQINKIEAMIAQKQADLLSIAAWPTETLHKSKGGEVAGFLMPRVSGYKPVHELYSPRSRRTEFPNADWRFLIHAAANISRAFAIVHSHNIVIGDVNHGNLVVAQNGTVKLIDCDSFQVQQAGRHYLCGVGVPEYTPPELAGGDLATMMRSENHDNFGLAVLIFHLLYLGRHPFAGRYLGSGYMPIEKAIKENRFAYGAEAQQKLMAPPPNTLPFSSAPADVTELFEDAFKFDGLFHTRPSAKQWVAALTNLSGQLKHCGRTPSHYYMAELNHCPWCLLENKTGIDFFAGAYYAPTVGFNVDLVWQKVSAIKKPRNIDFGRIQIAEPSEMALKDAGYLKWRRVVVVLALIILAGVSAYITSVIPVAAGALGIFIFIPFIFPNKAKKVKIYESMAADAQDNFETLLDMIIRPVKEFETLKDQLLKQKTEYQNMPMERARGLELLKAGIRERQMQKYLEQFEIKPVPLKNIGEGRKQMLMSFGIETAADVSPKNVGQVPGFGTALIRTLMEWRKELEKGFVFDASKGIDARDIATLDKKINERKSAIESSMNKGTARLQALADDCHKIRQVKKEELERAEEILAQARFDCEYLRRVRA